MMAQNFEHSHVGNVLDVIQEGRKINLWITIDGNHVGL